MSTKNKVGLGFVEILSLGTFFIFLTAKLAGWVSWSWWWITSPLWIGLAFVLSVLSVFLVYWTVKGYKERNANRKNEEMIADQKWEADVHGFGDDDTTRH